jgi:hypothetical protein
MRKNVNGGKVVANHVFLIWSAAVHTQDKSLWRYTVQIISSKMLWRCSMRVLLSLRVSWFHSLHVALVPGSPLLPFPLPYKHIPRARHCQRCNIAVTFYSVIKACPRQKVATVETGNTWPVTTFISLHSSLSCQTTEFIYTPRLLGHSLYSEVQTASLY